MKILIATDGSEFSERAIDALANIAVESKSTSFKIIAAFEFPPMIASDSFVSDTAEDYDQIEEAGRAEATERSEDAAARLRSLFPNVSADITTEIIQGAPQSAIIEAAESWRADFIVVGSHNHGLLKRTVLGSVSGAIVQDAPCSVLVVRKSGYSADEV